MEAQQILIARTILRRRMRQMYHLLDLKLYYKAIIIKQHGTGTKTDTQIKEME